ncbi:hypothetical protein ACO0K0_00130 [Undibacterium sp. SXout11W]|uniref:hypothetical protein n=1 Tax=Undibacterium sp. SXout11W TaxID=3413050 RepID=UPI003BF4440C
MAISAKLPSNSLSIIISPTYPMPSLGGNSLYVVGILEPYLWTGSVFGVVAVIQFSWSYFISYVGLLDIKTIGK